MNYESLLFLRGVHWQEVVIAIVRVVVAFAGLMVAVMMMIWLERKVISDMQARIGPNRAGPYGLLQTLADGVKLFFKEDLVPERADRFVFKLAPYLSILPAFIAFAIVPVGATMSVAGYRFHLQVANPPIGILLLLAMSSISVYGVMLAGWSSGSKYPLLGSVRASAQMISYEAAMGMSVIMVVLMAGTLSTRGIVDAQAGTFFASWGLIRTGIVPFFIFLAAVTAETNRPPFDFVEADSELVGGFNTEYSSIRFALFYLAEFMNTITMSAVIVTLFLGGPDGPSPHIMVLNQIVPVLWFLGKTFIFLFAYIWFRAALPRLRYDQLMNLGWKVLIPLSLVWLLIVAGGLVSAWWVVGLGGAMLVGGGLLYRAVWVGRQRQAAGDFGPEAARALRPRAPLAGRWSTGAVEAGEGTVLSLSPGAGALGPGEGGGAR
ncbi:NADH-quinone oxidoreductase subunit NuoH [Aciditerrimonas ferrireducens]|uniref:NADH-quinone oxidoreductase subunit H n=1 Tax=Aciditerrimonas ferrireducens TaxID=667306 RepID=A0ABV6C3K4_9ACTN